MGVLLKLPKPQVKPKPEDPAQPPTIQKNPTKEYAAKLRAFLDRKAPYEHPIRIRRHSTWRKADLYDASVQWLAKSYNVDPTRSPHWTERQFREDDPDQIPMPVFNYMSSRLQNEASRLGRPEYKAYVRPSGENPDAKTKEAAKFSGDVLTGTLDAMKWSTRVAEIFFRHLPQYGGGTIKSYWDVSLDKTVRIPKTSAMKCPQCEFKISAPDLNVDEFGAVEAQYPGKVTRTPVPGELDEYGAAKEEYKVQSCLTCEDHEESQTITEDVPATDDMGMPMMGPDGMPMMVPTERMETLRVPGAPMLEPFTPIDGELTQQDSFGRDLGEDVPEGEWMCDVVSPYDMFWENLGIDVDPHTWAEVEQVTVRSLDWIRARRPDKADLVKAENAEALLKWHPIAGERAVFYGSVGASGLFKNHARVKEYHKKPYLEWNVEACCWKLNRGRSIEMTAGVTGDVVLLDGPFMLESKVTPGQLIPRVHYEYVPWEYRSGGRELDGMSMSELMFDAQDNINECKSQTQDTRQRMASPKWRVTRGMNFDYEQIGNAGSMWVWDPDPNDPNKEPVEVGSTTISEGVAREVERDIEYMDEAGNTKDVELGNIPTNASSGTMLQLTAEQAGERRKPRIRRIREAFERIWGHGLILMHEFVREPRKLRMRDQTDEWRERSWKGADLMGQTDVVIDAEPEHDTALQKKENVREAVSLKVLDPATSKRARMVIAKKLDVPADLTEDDDLQYDCAEHEFWDYVDQGHAPVVDEDLDDHEAHDQRHGVDCLSEKWKTLERQADWDGALVYLSGWDKADPMGGMDSMGMPLPGLAPWQKIEQAMGQQWPPLLELRILEAWKILLQLGGYQPKNQQALDQVMRFRAHRASHRMALKQQVQATQMGAPVIAAPEAQSTSAGTMPMPGAPVA